jgi:SAM-dependent methyltransferase
MLDLCCGLGGVYREFQRAGWFAVGVDIAAWVKPTIVADIRALPLAPRRWDFIWASEPCTYYSRFSQPGLYPNEPLPDLGLARCIRALIAELKPARWVVENVWGARRFYREIFGPVRARVPGHVFYGMPLLIPQVRPHKHTIGEQVREEIRKAKRAMIPREIVQVVIAQLGEA